MADCLVESVQNEVMLFESQILQKFAFSKFNIWRIRLVGRGRTIGNRVTGNTVPEFESLILRQRKTAILIQRDCGFCDFVV